MTTNEPEASRNDGDQDAQCEQRLQGVDGGHQDNKVARAWLAGVRRARQQIGLTV
jgi:hypothetical protein